MYIKRCCVCRRDDTSKPGIAFHVFPKNEHYSNIWAHNIGKPEILKKSPEERNKKFFVCSRHFEFRMFPNGLIGTRLKRDAYPTLFEEPPKKRLQPFGEGMSQCFSSEIPPKVELPLTLKEARIPEPISDIELLPMKGHDLSTSRSLSDETPEVASYEDVALEDLPSTSRGLEVAEEILGLPLQAETGHDTLNISEIMIEREEVRAHGDHCYTNLAGPPTMSDVSVQTPKAFLNRTPRVMKYQRKIKTLRSKLLLKEALSSRQQRGMEQSTVDKEEPVLHRQTHELIARLIAFMMQEAEVFQQTQSPLIPLTNFKQRVLTATGISHDTYEAIVRESVQLNREAASEFKLVRMIKLGEDQKEIIRTIVREFHITEKRTPTVKDILMKIRACQIDFKGGETTLRKFLEQLGFSWQKAEGNRIILTECHGIGKIE